MYLSLLFTLVKLFRSTKTRRSKANCLALFVLKKSNDNKPAPPFPENLLPCKTFSGAIFRQTCDDRAGYYCAKHFREPYSGRLAMTVKHKIDGFIP